MKFEFRNEVNPGCLYINRKFKVVVEKDKVSWCWAFARNKDYHRLPISWQCSKFVDQETN